MVYCRTVESDKFFCDYIFGILKEIIKDSTLKDFKWKSDEANNLCKNPTYNSLKLESTGDYHTDECHAYGFFEIKVGNPPNRELLKIFDVLFESVEGDSNNNPSIKIEIIGFEENRRVLKGFCFVDIDDELEYLWNEDTSSV